MKRHPLISLLNAYKPEPGEEQEMYNATKNFVQENPDCFERTLLSGHVTASGWVISPERDIVLLMHHRKLDRWFQPGGHCDGDPDVAFVARKEVEEETGITNFRLLNEAIFDVDVHLIPASQGLPAHYHYDIRFLFEADPAEHLIINSESKDVKWIPVEQVKNLNDSESIMRMIRKVRR